MVCFAGEEGSCRARYSSSWAIGVKALRLACTRNVSRAYAVDMATLSPATPLGDVLCPSCAEIGIRSTRCALYVLTSCLTITALGRFDVQCRGLPTSAADIVRDTRTLVMLCIANFSAISGISTEKTQRETTLRLRAPPPPTARSVVFHSWYVT